MATGLRDAIRSLVNDRGISEELIQKTIEEFLFAAYKRKFGTVENAVVTFSEDGEDVALYARKTIVDEVDDEVLEISLEDSLALNEDCEIGDELLISIDPKEFDRIAVQSAKQKAKQTLRDIQKDTLYSEFKGKEGEMVIGYYQREKGGDIFIDLGKTEGIMPKRFQSPREVYRQNDRIKCLIYSVEKAHTGLRILLSRTHTDFVAKLFEIEVPEVYDRTIEIHKMVREPGYRTKLAVYTNREDIDPVGACVGLKGVRIQTIVRELEGEKIDVLRYDLDPVEYIKNALSPADVKNVYILDYGKKSALAVVDESQLSLAIGKQGLNVRLANRLVDWNIDVKTEEQFREMDVSVESKRELEALFIDDGEEGEITTISDLPGIEERIIAFLEQNNIVLIEDYINMSEEQVLSIPGITKEDVQSINAILSEYVDIVEEETAEEYVETFECPECGFEITADMETCPNCGVGLSFEEEVIEE
ncbi:MAG: transcription termination factor NusA [Spirochaetia bacterium]|nr:transcription termination factor NusA [Spirochaetia bacterium]